jgi:hypothetical protein
LTSGNITLFAIWALDDEYIGAGIDEDEDDEKGIDNLPITGSYFLVLFMLTVFILVSTILLYSRKAMISKF